MAISYTAGNPSTKDFHVAPGDYKLKVIEAEEDTSKAGNDMIKLKLRIIKSDGGDGPALFDYLVFSESSLWRVDAFLKSCDQHPGEGVKVDIDPTAIIGWECEAKLAVDDYDGKKSNKVAAYLFDEGF